MKFKVQVTFLNCFFGGSMVRSWDLTNHPGPEDLKKMFGALRPPNWMVQKVDVVEIVNEEEVKNPVTFKLQDDIMAAR